jgi:hypothetical protein
MKNQYFGDQTDYLKYGILRAIVATGIPLGIHWTLTEDDSSSDGSRIKYLGAATRWRNYDPSIFDAILERVRAGDRRLRVVEELAFVPNAIHCFDRWECSAQIRLDSIDALMKRLPSNSVVFLDPDNGLEVGSTQKGKLGASKYIFLDEVSKFWEGGHSIIIYQHYPRVQRVPYVQEQLKRLNAVLCDMNGAALLTSHVAFLACVQSDHRHKIEAAFSQVVEHWSPHVSTVTFEGDVVGPLAAPPGDRAFQAELPL